MRVSAVLTVCNVRVLTNTEIAASATNRPTVMPTISSTSVKPLWAAPDRSAFDLMAAPSL